MKSFAEREKIHDALEVSTTLAVVAFFLLFVFGNVKIWLGNDCQLYKDGVCVWSINKTEAR
jgi:hypothetical protein